MTARPVLIDGFCGAGGAAKGYQRAGFYVVGIDIEDQPNYCGDEFIKADVIDVLAMLSFGLRPDLGQDVRAFWDEAVAWHVSPVCKDHTKLKSATKREDGTGWQLGASRHFLAKLGLPWVIENVPGAPMRPDFKLCGCMFELPGLRRERWFETSWRGFSMRAPCQHVGEPVTVTGHGAQGRQYRAGVRHTQDDRRRAMGIDWMNRDELSQAIPPDYTEHIGEQLRQHLEAA